MHMDNNLITLNTKIDEIIRLYFEGVNIDINICFDLPDPNAPPAEPTISIFLYSAQEDLQLRHGTGRQYARPDDGTTLYAGHINIRFDYLITYWGPKADPNPGRDSGPANQEISTMNIVLNALINTRELSGIPASYTRVVAPQELGNLSHFWQALGNKPRLCLNYSVTIPLQLGNESNVEAFGTPTLHVRQT